MKELFLELGIDLSNDQLEKFNKYFEFLVEWNEKINLTTIVEEKEVHIKHFFDSLSVVKIYDFKDQSICDIGSGAGFPGIPLKIIFPELKLTIIDSLKKRIDFLELLAKELDLEMTCVHARAEEYIKYKREKFDVVFARAVAKLNILSELCVPYVKVGGFFISFKGGDVVNEVKQSMQAFEKLGASLDNVVTYQLPYKMGERSLVKVIKIKATNQTYPRIFGKIKKLPL